MAVPANKFRKETVLTLNGHSYACRPTLDKIARIESRYGPALQLARRVAESNATQVELTNIVQVMLMGAHNKPRDQDVAELVFEQGVNPISSSVVEFLLSATTSDAVKPGEEDGAQEAGNP
jgi:hypothetical protein